MKRKRGVLSALTGLLFPVAALAAAGALYPIPASDAVRSANLSAAVEAASVGGSLYAYPLTADNGYFLYYNKAYFTDEDVGSLERMLEAAAQAEKLLKPGGHFFLVHRPFRLAEIITELVRRRLEPKRMQLVYPFVDKEPNMVLLEGLRGGNSRLTVEKPLIVYREAGVYTDEIYEIYGY